MNILTWLTDRSKELTTYTGVLGTIATAIVATVFHKELSATDAGTIATIVAGVVSGGLIAVTTKNPATLISTVVSDIPGAITVVGDLKAQANVALASGDGAKYQALMDAHEASKP